MVSKAGNWLIATHSRNDNGLADLVGEVTTLSKLSATKQAADIARQPTNANTRIISGLRVTLVGLGVTALVYWFWPVQFALLLVFVYA